MNKFTQEELDKIVENHFSEDGFSLYLSEEPQPEFDEIITDEFENYICHNSFEEDVDKEESLISQLRILFN